MALLRLPWLTLRRRSALFLVATASLSALFEFFFLIASVESLYRQIPMKLLRKIEFGLQVFLAFFWLVAGSYWARKQTELSWALQKFESQLYSFGLTFFMEVRSLLAPTALAFIAFFLDVFRAVHIFNLIRSSP